MAQPSQTAPLKALDGAGYQNVNPADTTASQNGSIEQNLPSRIKPNRAVSSKSSVRPPGQILTGRQEHCKPHISLLDLHADTAQTSSENSSPRRSHMRLRNLRLRPPYNDLVPPSSQTMEKWLQLTPTFPFFVTSSSTMSVTSRSWTRQGRKNFGKTSYKWYEHGKGHVRDRSRSKYC